MNKKGFTLAELLAVLIVLGIIATITIPIVTDQVDEHRKKLCITQYESILTAARAYGADNIMTLKDGDTVTLATLQQKGYIDENIKNPVTKEEISNDLIITINNVGTNNVKFKYSFNKSIDSYCDANSEEEEENEEFTTGKAINYNPVSNEKCNNPTSTTGTKTGCMKWYVIKDNGSSVDAILDHNTTAKVAYETSGTYKEYAQASIKSTVDTDTQGWASGLNPRLITANEVAGIVGNTSWNSSTATSSQYFFFGSLNTTDYSSQTEEQKARQRSFVWLFDYTNGCTSYGCNTADGSTNGYWTNSPVSDDSNLAWHVSNIGILGRSNVNDANSFGVRPVITIQKSVLK